MISNRGVASYSFAHAKALRFCIVAAIFAAMAGCGGGGGLISGGGGGGGIVSDISNTWEGFDSAGRKVSLLMFAVGNPSGKGQVTGTLDGATSVLSVYDATDNSPPSTKVSGSYDGASITITLETPSAPLVQNYNGIFTDADTIVFRPAAGSVESLTMRRTGFFSSSFVDNWNGAAANGHAWLIQLGTAPGYDQVASARVQGAEMLDGRISRVSGYVNVRAVHLEIHRASGTLVLDGEFPKSGAQIDGDTISFGSMTLRRGGEADAQKVAFLAQADRLTELYVGDARGNTSPKVAPPLGASSEVLEYFVSPDKSKIISIVLDALGPSLYVTNVASKVTGRLGDLPSTNSVVLGGSVEWSSDGKYAAFLANAVPSNVPGLFVVHVDELKSEKVSQVDATAPTVPRAPSMPVYKWAPSPSGIQVLAFAVAETLHADRSELFLYRPSEIPERTRIIALPANYDVTGVSWSGDSSRLAFLLKGRGDSTDELFISTSTQGGFPADTYVPISTVPSFGAITDIEWSGNSNFVAFRLYVAGAIPHRYELHTLAKDATQSVLVSDVNGSPMNYDIEVFSWAPDSAKLAFYARDIGTSLFGLYSTDPAGNGQPTILTSEQPPALSNGVTKPRWNLSSERVLFESMAGTPHYALSSVRFDGFDKQTIHSKGSTDCEPVGQLDWVGARWSPDGARVASVVSTGDALGDCALFITNADGTDGQTLDLRPRNDIPATISEYVWMPDSARVAYIQKSYTDGMSFWGELRLGSVSSDGASVRLFGKEGETIFTRGIAAL